MDSGATASIDSAHMQEVVQRKMAAAELARQRGARDEEELQMEERAEEARAKVGTRKDGSFGLLNDDTYEDGEVRNEEEIIKPLDRVEIKPILKNGKKEGDSCVLSCFCLCGEGLMRTVMRTRASRRIRRSRS